MLLWFGLFLLQFYRKDIREYVICVRRSIMHDRKIPAYVICGNSVETRSAFYKRFCTAKRPLFIHFGHHTSKGSSHEDSCVIPVDMTPDAIGLEIAVRLGKEPHDAVWMEWDDANPIQRLLDITRQADFRRPVQPEKNHSLRRRRSGSLRNGRSQPAAADRAVRSAGGAAKQPP